MAKEAREHNLFCAHERRVSNDQKRLPRPTKRNPFNDRLVNDPSAKPFRLAHRARERTMRDSGTMLNRGLIYGRGRRQRSPGGRKFLFECADRQRADKHGNAEVHRCASSNTEVKSV